MLAPPQPAFLGRNGSNSKFTLKNASMTSLSSSNNSHEVYGSWSQTKRNSYSGSSQSNRGSADADAHAREAFFASQRGSSWKDSPEETSDVESRGHSTSASSFAIRKRSKAKGGNATNGDSSGDGVNGKGGGGTIKGLGRRLFKRTSSANLHAPGPPAASRSNSASSSSTAPSSPPLTPTTPSLLPVLPLWLPNGRKDFFGDSPNLPPISLASSAKPVQSLDVTLGAMDAKSIALSPSLFSQSLASSSTTRPTHLYSEPLSPTSHAPEKDPSPASNPLSLPTLPETTAARSEGRSSGGSAIGSGSSNGNTSNASSMPALIEESADSDFLRAVLNFGESGDDAFTGSPSSSNRGGRAAPLPTRSSSLFQSSSLSSSAFSSFGFNSTSSFSFYATGSSLSSGSFRREDGRLVMTEAAAKELSTVPSYKTKVRPLHVRPGLFRRDSDDSEDNYGDEDQDATASSATSAAAPVSPTSPTSPSAASSFKQTLSYLSSLAKSKAKPPSPSTAFGKAVEGVDASKDDENEYVVLRPSPPGLDTPSKRSLYTCTLLKVHPYLAPTLVPSLAEAQGGLSKVTAELRFPRSINAEGALHHHMSTLGVPRSLRAAVGRTEVMRKLKKCSLPIEQEVEISWFQRKYSTESVSPDTIRSALVKRQMGNPEALARPPIMAPNFSASRQQQQEAAGDLASCRRLSGIVGLAPGQKLNSAADPEYNGMIVWARRPGFSQRYAVITAEDAREEGNLLVAPPQAPIGIGSVLPPATRTDARPQPISFSPRIRILAGLPSIEDERRLKTPVPTKFRQRESNRLSRVSASEAGYGGRSRQPSADGTSDDGRPTREQRPREAVRKALPPWVAPRQSKLLPPNSVSRSPSLGSRSPVLSQDGSDSSRTTPASNARRNSKDSSQIGAVKEEDEDQGSESEASSEEDVPLGQLRDFRTHRAAEMERIRKLEEELAQLKLKDQIREKEERERREREREALRLEAERAMEIRKAREQAMLQEKAKKMLTEARERRSNTRQSALLAAPNYGAGSPLAGPAPRLQKQPSSSNLAETGPSATSDSRSRKMHHSASLAQLSGRGGETSLRPNASPSMGNGLYALPEHAGSRASMQPPPPQRGSMMSLAPAASPVAPPGPAKAGTVQDSARNSLVPPQAPLPLVTVRGPETKSIRSPPRSSSVMSNAAGPSTGVPAGHTPIPPARRTSMMPPAFNVAPGYGGAGPGAMHSMSMSNLQAQAYLQAHQQHQQHHWHGQPGSQTMRASSRPGRGSMMASTPLVSLYGNAIPNSASQRANGWM